MSKDTPREPHVLSAQELADIERFITREYSRDLLDDCGDELVQAQANLVPDLVCTVRGLQEQLGRDKDILAAVEAREKPTPADWLDPDELNERIARALNALTSADGFVRDILETAELPSAKACWIQIELLEHGISALTGPSK